VREQERAKCEEKPQGVF